MKILIVGVHDSESMEHLETRLLECGKNITLVPIENLKEGIRQNPDAELAIINDDLIPKPCLESEVTYSYEMVKRAKEPFIDLKKIPGKSGWRPHYKYHP